MTPWELSTSADQPSHLRELLFQTAQRFELETATVQEKIVELLATHPARDSTDLASTWAEGIFSISKVEAGEILAAHQASRADTESRATASRLIDQLAAWPQAPTADETRDEVLLQRLGLPGYDDETQTMHTLTGDELLEHFERHPLEPHLSALFDAGIVPAAVFDLDGTLWGGDLGEALFEHAISEQLMAPEGIEAVNSIAQRLGIPASGTKYGAAQSLLEQTQSGELWRSPANAAMPLAAKKSLFYQACWLAFAGLTQRAVKEISGHVFDQIVAHTVFAQSKKLVAGLHRLNLKVFAVSATGGLAAAWGAARLGIPPWRVAGFAAQRSGDLLLPKMSPPITFGPGKVEALGRMMTGRPLFTFGDRPRSTDRELFEAALGRWVVRPDLEDLDHVRSQGHRGYRLVTLS